MITPDDLRYGRLVTLTADPAFRGLIIGFIAPTKREHDGAEPDDSALVAVTHSGQTSWKKGANASILLSELDLIHRTRT